MLTAQFFKPPHVHFRELRLYTNKPFQGQGNDLRLAITGAFPDRPVLHNHKGEAFDYRSPRVRYLVLDRIPRLISFEEGLDILEEIYRSGGILRVGREEYAVSGTELEERIERVGVSDTLITYRSVSPWLALNQNNFAIYRKLQSDDERKMLLSAILIGNYLSFCKTVKVEVKEKITLIVKDITERHVTINNKKFLGFEVQFVTNMLIPELIGLGKLVSKGFGVMRKI